MPSSALIRFTISVAGSPLVFGQPFAAPTLTLEEDPAIFTVQIAAAALATLWSGLPLPETFDLLALTADQDCDIQVTVENTNQFTLFLRGGGWPLILPGGESYAGGACGAISGGTVGQITKLEAQNRNTTTVANVSVLLGKAA